jgi:hypothetical protein
MTGWLSRIGAASQILAAALSAALGLRLMSGAIAEAQAQRYAAARAGPTLALPTPIAEPVASPGAQPLPETRKADAISLRLMLSVLVGPQRSEVFVNGARLGLSPYFGQLSCKQGENLRIEVVPAQPRAPLITRQVRCEGENLLVRD